MFCIYSYVLFQNGDTLDKCVHFRGNISIGNRSTDFSLMFYCITGERPYICHVCGKGLISDKKLKRHLLIHSEVQRHTCDVCGQGFSMKYKLRTHMFVHTGKIEIFYIYILLLRLNT